MNRPQASLEKAKRVPLPNFAIHSPIGSFEGDPDRIRFDCDYRTVSVLRFPYGGKGETYDFQCVGDRNSLGTLAFLCVLLQGFPLRYQIADLPHQRLVSVNDLL